MGLTTAHALQITITDLVTKLQQMPAEIQQHGPGIILKWLNPWEIDWNQVNYGFVLMFTAFMGFVAMAVYANLTDAPVAPGVQPGNVAAGADGGVTHKEGAPPIPPPTEVVSLRVYPIKSCRGFEVSGTRLRPSGLLLDRNWMFVGKDDRKFLTIRSDPSMTLIDTAIVEGPNDAKPGSTQQMLQVSIHGTDARIAIPAFPNKDWLEQNTTLSQIEIWEDHTDAYEYGPSINQIFSDFFRKPVALVYKGPAPRLVNINGRAELYGKETQHHFADVMSLQVASEASLKDLNRRLKALEDPTVDSLTIERFRPNIIVRGRDTHPWEEDTWKRIRVTTTLPSEEALYKIDLDVVARCARCQVPNVNPDTAEKHPKQPWEELMKCRRVDQGGPAKWKPCFGMLAIPKNGGKIQVGARLEVLETTDKHLYGLRKFEDL